MDSDGLDLSSQGTTASEAGKEGKLHCSHDFTAGLARLPAGAPGRGRWLEGRLVGGQVSGAAHAISGSTKLVSGKHAHDNGHITGAGAPQGDTGRT